MANLVNYCRLLLVEYILYFMIITFTLLTLHLILVFFTGNLPTWQIWPDSVLNGLYFFSSTLAQFNFIFPVDVLFQALIFFIIFFSLLLPIKILLKIFNR